MCPRSIARTVLLALLLPLPAGAGPFENLVEKCSDAGTSAGDAWQYCYRAAESDAMKRQSPQVQARILMNAGVASFNLGRYSEAVDAQSRALALDPALGAAYASRAQAYEMLGRTVAAAADHDAAVRLAPDEASAWLGRGVARLKAGDAAGARDDFDRAVRLEPDWAAPYYNRGVAHARLGDFARAETDFSAVLSREPENARALVSRGKARAALGRPGAGEDFDNALRLRPEWAAGWFARAEYHDVIGQREAANADYMRAYQLGHSDPKLIERVRQIGGG